MAHSNADIEHDLIDNAASPPLVLMGAAKNPADPPHRLMPDKSSGIIMNLSSRLSNNTSPEGSDIPAVKKARTESTAAGTTNVGAAVATGPGMRPSTQSNGLEPIQRGGGFAPLPLLHPLQHGPGLSCIATSQPQQPNSHTMISVPPPPHAAKSALLTRPIALLFLGPRGSGKSTQGKQAAERFDLLFVSSGELVRAGGSDSRSRSHPMSELRRIVLENFGPGVPRKYSGLALDRFINVGEVDVFYLQWALHSACPDLDLPVTFILQMDWEVALKRADARCEDVRPKSTQRRMIEQRAMFDASEKLLAPANLVHRIQCEDMSPEAIFKHVESIVIKHIASSATATPRTYLLQLGGDIASTMHLIVDYDMFLQLKCATHAALYNNYIDSAPISQMAEIVQQCHFDDRKSRASMATSFATLKADGSRIVLVKHRTLGVFAFPQAFHCVFDANLMFGKFSWPKAPTNVAALPTDIEFILDCELVRTRHSSPTVMVFDFVYFFGTAGKKVLFSRRLEKLQTYFASRLDVSSPIELKEYVPIQRLRTLLPNGFSQPPFPVDGIVIQHDVVYKYGPTKDILKWKPLELTTVDFRLFGGTAPTKDAPYWAFTPKVQAMKPDRTWDEETYPNAVVRIRTEDVENCKLSDGSIVECVRLLLPADPAATKEGAQPPTVWSFVRDRSDKILPNKIEVVQSIESAIHLSFDCLLQSCESLE